jgi:hypothetical protein
VIAHLRGAEWARSVGFPVILKHRPVAADAACASSVGEELPGLYGCADRGLKRLARRLYMESSSAATPHRVQVLADEHGDGTLKRGRAFA